MNTPENDREFERRTRALFERSVSQLDASTRSKLAQARARALHAADDHAPHRRWRVWGPLTGLAAAALATVAVLFERRSEHAEPAPLDDLNLLAHDDPELLQDYDFYAWLDEQPDWKS